MNRRSALQLMGFGSLMSVGPELLQRAQADSIEGGSRSNSFLHDIEPTIHFVTDGILLSPIQYSRLLLKLTSQKTFQPDSEGEGGVIKELESKFAVELGTEDSIYMPTGTMANQLALRVLAEGKSKGFVQETSHVLNNEGDAAQEIHHKRLMPLAAGKATFSLDDLLADIRKFQEREIFRTEIGAISIENPVKAMHEVVFDIQEIRSISSFARDNGIGMHLDGARLHIASAYSGIPVRQYASYFDTVYVSLYKYLGASAGAVLCGPKKIIDRMRHLVKVLGGNMATNWNTACVALHFLPSFIERYQIAISKAQGIFWGLNYIDGLRVEAFENGSNVYKLVLENNRYDQFVSYLRKEKEIYLRPRRNSEEFLLLKVNETLNYIRSDDVVSSFDEAYEATR